MTKRRKIASIVAAALGILLVAAMVVPALLPAREASSGRRPLEVNVRVTDADHAPIHGAVITVYDHPVSPEEGRLPPLDSRAHDLESFATDADGWCRLGDQLRASRHSYGRVPASLVNIAGTWIKVSAAGFKSTFVPLDRSSQPRAAEDESPLRSTVVLARGSD